MIYSDSFDKISFPFYRVVEKGLVKISSRNENSEIIADMRLK